MIYIYDINILTLCWSDLLLRDVSLNVYQTWENILHIGKLCNIHVLLDS